MMRFLLPTLLTLACTVPALAQAAAPMPGDPVRVRSAAASGRFVVDGADSATLTLRKPDGSIVRVPIASLKRLSVSGGPRTRGAGALRGAFIGGTLGAAGGFAAGYITSDDSFLSREQTAAAMGVLVGGAGVLVGLLVGSAAPGERWEAVPLSSLRAGASGDGGAGLSYTLRF